MIKQTIRQFLGTDELRTRLSDIALEVTILSERSSNRDGDTAPLVRRLEHLIERTDTIGRGDRTTVQQLVAKYEQDSVNFRTKLSDIAAAVNRRGHEVYEAKSRADDAERKVADVLGHLAELVGRVTNTQRRVEEWDGLLQDWKVELTRMDALAGARAVDRIERKLDWIASRLLTRGHMPNPEPYPFEEREPHQPGSVPDALEQARVAMRWYGWHQVSDQDSMEYRSVQAVERAIALIEDTGAMLAEGLRSAEDGDSTDD